MPIYRIQTSLQDKSGMPRDQYVNSLHVDSTTGVGSFNQWMDAVKAFYNGIGTRLSSVLSIGGHTIKVYDLSLPKESPPVANDTFNLATLSGSVPYPNEVAICLSFKGVRNPAWNPQSNRGRIYIGPLSASVGSSTTGAVHPAAVVRQEIVDQAVTLSVALNAGLSRWVVYSKLHNAPTAVTQVSVDDEFDTQRSRGGRATTKTIGAVAP